MKRLSLAFNIQAPLASSTALTVLKPMGSITLVRTSGPTWVRVPQKSDLYLKRRSALSSSSMTSTRWNTLLQQA